MPAARTENLAKRSIGRLHDAADDIVDDAKTEARGKIREATGAMRDAYGQTRRKAEDLVGDARQYLRDQSLLTLGVGVAIGLFMSLALRSETRPRRSAREPRPGHT